MKNSILIMFSALLVISCNKIQEKIDDAIIKTKEKAEQKAHDAVKETIEEQANSLINAENVEFQNLFPNADPNLVTEFKGKKIKLPLGSTAYLLKYKADKTILIPFLEKQPTTDDAKSDMVAKKIDGKSIVDKIMWLQKFLPENTLDNRFLEDLKTDKNLEFYKLKRYPNVHTLIYNPKTNVVYQFIDVNT